MDKTPECWLLLCSQSHQDFLIDYPDFWSGVVDIFSSLDAQEQKALIDFIHHCIEKEREKPGMLKKLWFQSGAQVGFERIKPIAFFADMVARFESVASGW